MLVVGILSLHDDFCFVSVQSSCCHQYNMKVTCFLCPLNGQEIQFLYKLQFDIIQNLNCFKMGRHLILPEKLDATLQYGRRISVQYTICIHSVL